MAVISFARGVPAPECLPVAELADCARAAIERFDRRVPLQPWLDRVRCTGDDAVRVVELLGRRVDGETVEMSSLVIRGRH